MNVSIVQICFFCVHQCAKKAYALSILSTILFVHHYLGLEKLYSCLSVSTVIMVLFCKYFIQMVPLHSFFILFFVNEVIFPSCAHILPLRYLLIPKYFLNLCSPLPVQRRVCCVFVVCSKYVLSRWQVFVRYYLPVKTLLFYLKKSHIFMTLIFCIWNKIV